MRVGNVISWRGGKSRLAKKIVQFFLPHEYYIEPFCGANCVIFNKNPKTSKHEVINDKHEELINFWRVVKYRSVDMGQRQNSIANYVRERKAFSNEILILNFDLKV